MTLIRVVTYMRQWQYWPNVLQVGRFYLWGGFGFGGDMPPALILQYDPPIWQCHNAARIYLHLSISIVWISVAIHLWQAAHAPALRPERTEDDGEG